MSQVAVDDLIRYFVLALIVLLGISLIAVIRTPSSPPSQAEQEAQEPAAQPEPVPQPVPAQPVLRRVPVVTADLADDYPGRHVRTPRVSGQPPWGPAPRPPDLIP
jgi:hypothetical protein